MSFKRNKMKVTISIELSMLKELSGIVLDQAINLVDKMEECRGKFISQIKSERDMRLRYKIEKI